MKPAHTTLFAVALWLFLGWLGWHVYQGYQRGNAAILEVRDKIYAALAGK